MSKTLDSIKTDDEVMRLPFIFTGDKTFEELKLCVIQVTIEGTKIKQSFALLVDTGADTTYLISAIANLVGVDSVKTLKVNGATGSSIQKQGTVKNIEIIQRIEVQGEEIEGKISCGASRVVILEKLPSSYSKYSIVGLLGAETIQGLCLQLDYPKRYLELSKKLEKIEINYE